MKKQIFTLALFSALASPGASLAGNIYVSPNGDDAAKGTVSEPLKTVEAALKQAREWRRLGSAEAEGGINIIMSGGVYSIDKPIFIRPEDSGTPESPTVIRGAEDIMKALCRQGFRIVRSDAGRTAWACIVAQKPMC